VFVDFKQQMTEASANLKGECKESREKKDRERACSKREKEITTRSVPLGVKCNICSGGAFYELRFLCSALNG